MRLKLKLKISVITIILFHMNNATAYEFQADNMTYLKSIIKEAVRSDALQARHTSNIKPKTYKELHPVPVKKQVRNLRNKLKNVLKKKIIFNKDNIDKELSKKENVLTEVLRMGPTIIREDADVEKENMKNAYIKIDQAQRARILKYMTKRVKDFMKFNYKATEYLFDEVLRIQRKRVVFDLARRIVAELENSHNRTYMEAMEDCMYHSIKQFNRDEKKRTGNKIIWHMISDYDNDEF